MLLISLIALPRESLAFTDLKMWKRKSSSLKPFYSQLVVLYQNTANHASRSKLSLGYKNFHNHIGKTKKIFCSWLILLCSKD